MKRDTLDTARKLMKYRKFSAAIKMLEGRSSIYENNFDYYLMLAIACMYVGDAGSASTYFQQARRIKLTDTTLLLGQAALFLRRGDTDRALQYYLEILDNDPDNKIALQALEFIRTRGDYNTICRWVDSGRIERFYPQLGVNPYHVIGIVVPVAACLLGCLLVFHVTRSRPQEKGPRADLSSFELSIDEVRNAQEKNMAGSTCHYLLTNRQITDSYAAVQHYFQLYRDNAAQVEINRLLSSNASVAIKQKAHLLMGYLATPTFDTLTDNPTYDKVAEDPLLYLDCWVSWSGRISNAGLDGTAYNCDLLVGYETMEKVNGIVPVHFAAAPQIDNDKPVRILAKIILDNGKLSLEGHSVYQSVKDSLEKP
jgi:tetratricopeptide (TPR) repeat protein